MLMLTQRPSLPFQVIVKKMAGRYRLVYQATGHLLLNLMGGPVDAGGYSSAGAAHAHATRINTQLQELSPAASRQPEQINARALALLLC
ncbi:hypothetical protein [Candidatus Magnetaquicoccus inordinatus]|uniref:hypothetical protein n=1 Tax=Candidatus Magnetaquicoccus inordinatus TaxID=2496818 RepID=UPI00102D0A85|nr:hypothetical protein [Candidatus Magnetaquicoccus inordinatus]